MHFEEIQKIHEEIEQLQKEADATENIPEKLERFDRIEVLDDRLFNLELQDLMTGVKEEVKNFFKFS